jgi:hypothetical protein
LSDARRHHTLAGIVNEQTFEIRVQPRAKRNAVVPQPDGSLKVYVTAPPENGRANEAVTELLAEYFDVKRRQIEILTGATNRNKVVRVTGQSRSGSSGRGGA